MSAVNSLFNAIESGKNGLNVGLPIGLPILQSMTYGVQRQTYTVLAGGTGLIEILVSLLYENTTEMAQRAWCLSN